MLFTVSSCTTIERINEDDGPVAVADDSLESGAVSDSTVEPIGDLALRVLHKADYIIDERSTQKSLHVLTTADSYADELKKYSVEFPASIDFEIESIIVATMGTQRSGGYAISATAAREYADKAVVEFELISPADNCLTTQAESNPYEFVKVPTRKPIEFVEVQRTQQCD